MQPLVSYHVYIVGQMQDLQLGRLRNCTCLVRNFDLGRHCTVANIYTPVISKRGPHYALMYVLIAYMPTAANLARHVVFTAAMAPLL